MTDQDVRDFLERMAAEEPTPFLDAEPLTRRARYRAARTVVVGAVGVAAALAVLFAGVAEIRTAPLPVAQPTPAPVASGALAYARYGDIYVADPDGSNAVKITDASADAGCEYSIPDPPWSPDGRYLAFERDCTSPRHTDVVIADPHGNIVAEFPTYGWGFTWSPDSTRVAVWEPDLTMGVYGVDGERQASLGRLPTWLTGGGNDAAPGWLPDGSALLLFGYAVVPLDGTAGYELPFLRPSEGGQAFYSPDGTRVAVKKHNSITVIDADGSPVSQVDARLDGVEAWSPDGDRFAALAHGELNVIDVASGTVTVLPEARAALDEFDEILDVRGFSPQGDRILYATDAGAGLGNTALWSIDVDGSDARLVVTGTAEGEWRPDSSLPPLLTASPSPVAQSPSPFTETFDSPLNGVSIGYPSGWRTRAATDPWGHGDVTFDAPDVDVIFDPTRQEDLYLAVISEPLGDTSGSDWGYDMWMNLESVGICTRAYGSGGGHAGSGGGSANTVHGNDAWFEHCGTPVGTDEVVIVATATRGYIINLHVADDRRLQATYGHDADWFEAALETVDLRPEDAFDVLNPSESP